MIPLRKIKRAKITSLDDSGLKFEFSFNPTNLKVERSSGLKGRSTEKLKLTSFAGLEWDGAGTDTLSFDFVLDETEPDWTNPAVALNLMNPIFSPYTVPAQVTPATSMVGVPLFNGSSVYRSEGGLLGGGASVLTKIREMTMLHKTSWKDGEIVRPHLVKMEWGDFKFFGGIKDFTYTFTLFDSDGLPKRAEVNLSLVGLHAEDMKSDDLMFQSKKSEAETVGNL